MCDVGKRARMYKCCLAFECLHEIRVQSVPHEHSDGARNLEIVQGDRFPGPIGTDDHVPRPLSQTAQRRSIRVSISESQNCHELTGNGDVVSGLTGTAVELATQPDDDIPKRPVIDIHHPPPGTFEQVDVEPLQTKLGKLGV